MVALAYEISQVNFRFYASVAKILDFIWQDIRRGGAPAASKHLGMLRKWRSSINKMKRSSSGEVSAVEQININRALKDIDSLLFRISKIPDVKAPIVSADEQSDESEESLAPEPKQLPSDEIIASE